MTTEGESRVTLFSEEVAEGVRSGDPDAVGAVYVVLADRLLGYLTARVRDRSAAEDLLELTFVELLQKGRTIRGGPASIKVWLFRAAHFNALDHLRRVTRRAEEFSDDIASLERIDLSPGPEEIAESAETTRRVRAAMAHLSEEQRQVLLLRYVAGLTAPEAGAVLNKSDGAVRSLQHRGERSLARLLSDQFPDRAAAPSAPPVGARSWTSRAQAASSPPPQTSQG